MKIAKIYFSMIPVIYGLSVVAWLDALTNYTFMILANVSILTLFLYTGIGIAVYLPLFKKVSIKCPNGGKV